MSSKLSDCLILSLCLIAFSTQFSFAQSAAPNTSSVPAGTPVSNNTQMNTLPNASTPPEISANSVESNPQKGLNAIDNNGAVGNPPSSAPPSELAPAATKLESKIVVKSFNSKVDDYKSLKRVKDPFMVPNYLYVKVKKALGDEQGEGFVDENAPLKKRWSLKHYKLVGLIWNVKEPKAIFSLDKDKDNLHVFYLEEAIGNNGGVIKEIRNGYVVVRDNDKELVVKMASLEKIDTGGTK